MKCLTYAQIKKMAEDAEWAIMANRKDAPKNAARYQRIAARLRNALVGMEMEGTK